ncbi:hypothetical protein R5M92_12865 [Halomonas sp. Bachu 37]|uniref:hypothetical protein n=1 Tax=Halomonas kashgarensis TaxID=3084920 RepID=UPI003217AB3A
MYRLPPPRNLGIEEPENNDVGGEEEADTKTAGSLPARRLEMAGDSLRKGGPYDHKGTGEPPVQNRQRTKREHASSSPASELNEEETVTAPAITCVALLQDPDQEERFARFWSAYPKGRGKREAVEVWKSIAPDEALTEKMLAVLEQAKSSHDWCKNSGQFIPFPAKWLRDYGWEDEWSVRVGPLGEIKKDKPPRPAESSSRRELNAGG